MPCIPLLVFALGGGIPVDRAPTIAVAAGRLDQSLGSLAGVRVERRDWLGGYMWDLSEAAAVKEGSGGTASAGADRPRRSSTLVLILKASEAAARESVRPERHVLSSPYVGRVDGPGGSECHEWRDPDAVTTVVACALGPFHSYVIASDRAKAVELVTLLAEQGVGGFSKDVASGRARLPTSDEALRESTPEEVAERDRAAAATVARLESALRKRPEFSVERPANLGPGRWAIWMLSPTGGLRRPEEAQHRIRVQLSAHDSQDAARKGMISTNRGLSIGYWGRRQGPLNGECHEFMGMGVVVSCFIGRFSILVNAVDFEPGWEAVNLMGEVIAGDSDAPGREGQ